MTNKKFIMDETGAVREVGDTLEWARSLEKMDRRIAYTDLGNKGEVSTVFLGLDHNFWSDGPPLLFETMVFGGPLSDEQDRYATKAEALAGHAAMVARLEGMESRNE